MVGLDAWFQVKVEDSTNIVTEAEKGSETWVTVNNVNDDFDTKDAKEQAKNILEDPETKNQVKTLKSIMDTFKNDTEGKYTTLKEEYKDLTNKIIKSYEGKIGEVLNNVEDNWEDLDISSLSPQEAAKLSDNIMKKQPQEINEQTAAINTVLNKGSLEQQRVLMETIKTMQNDIKEMYDKIQTIDNKIQ